MNQYTASASGLKQQQTSVYLKLNGELVDILSMCETNRVVVVPTTPKSEEFAIVVADMNKVNQTVHAEFKASVRQLRE